MTQTWSVYILACADGTLYTGIATDITRRVEDHNTSPKGARYTRGRRPVRLIFSKTCGSKSAALKEEARIKRLPRRQKQRLIIPQPLRID